MSRLIKTSILSFFLVFSFCYNAICQSSFIGYYITNNNDTIRGAFPGYKEWTINPSTIQFDGNSGSKNLTPSNCREFKVEGFDNFVSFTGKKMINPYGSQAVESKYADSTEMFEDVNVFLREIFKLGDTRLFSLTSRYRNNFYFSNLNGEIVELKNKSYYQEISEQNAKYRNILVESAIYRTQLQLAFEELIAKNRLNKELSSLLYGERELRKFFEKLYGINTKKMNLKKTYPTEFFVLAGAAFQSFNIKGVTTVATETKYNNLVSPVFGIGCNLYHQRNFGKFFIMTQLKLSSFKTEGENSGYATKIRSGLLLDLNFSPAYNFVNKPNLKWYISAGAGINYLTKNSETRGSKYVSIGTTEHDNRKFSVCFPVHTGLVFNKKMMVWGGYYFPVRINDFSLNSTYYSALQIGGAYLFR